MRTILILLTSMTQLFLTNISFAGTESYDDCKTSCAAAKGSRDIDCPSPYDSSTAGQERDQCLKASQETYGTCVKGCPPSSPPAESNPSTMSY